MPTLEFPKGFLWGAATSAYQVEGHNTNDWSEWEKQNTSRLAHEAVNKFGHLSHWPLIKNQAENPENYISGSACDHYHRYAQDFDIARQLGHNTHRFSIEWSRIEPGPGEFDEAAIEHYRVVLMALRERGLTPFVTLWHWTLPVWLARAGGVENPRFADYFTRYTAFVVEHLKDLATFWITLNEPTSVIGAGFLNAQWPPQKKNPLSAWRVYHRLADAHCQAYRVIHKLQPTAQVGFANILQSFIPYQKQSSVDRWSVRVAKFFTNEYMLRLTPGCNDFLAVQYYFHTRLKFIRRTHNKDHSESDLGWEIYPEGIYHILRWLDQTKLPIYITENGLADALDGKRAAFIRDHLFWIHRAIQEGIDVRGYFYWSLLDNFEWDKGFWPRFGLVEVNHKTQARRIRESAWEYASICKSNQIHIEDGSPLSKKFS